MFRLNSCCFIVIFMMSLLPSLATAQKSSEEIKIFSSLSWMKCTVSDEGGTCEAFRFTRELQLHKNDQNCFSHCWRGEDKAEITGTTFKVEYTLFEDDGKYTLWVTGYYGGLDVDDIVSSGNIIFNSLDDLKSFNTTTFSSKRIKTASNSWLIIDTQVAPFK